MEKLRFGIVGFGTQGSLYSAILSGKEIPGLPPVKAPEHCCLSAICVRSPEKARALQEQFPGIAVFDDYKEMLSSGACDGVIPTVPHYLHPEYAIAALKQGIHVLSEKPAGVRARDVREMTDWAKAHPETKLGLFFNQRTNRLYRRIKEIVDSGELGQIRRSNWIINSWWRPDSYYQQNPWRGTWGGEGGGVLVNQAPHQLDLWQWICGVPCEVTSLNRNGAYRDISVENDVTMITRYPNGATGCFITCTHDPIGTDRLEIDLDGGKILVEDSRKATIYRLKWPEQEMNAAMTMQEAAMLTRGSSAGGLYETEVLEHTDAWGFQHREVLENFARHVLFGEPLLATGEDGLMGVRLANASQLSAWTGQWVPVPCDEEQYNRELNRRIREEGKFPERD